MRRLREDHLDRERVRRVVARLDSGDAWIIRPIGSGIQGRVFAVRRQDGKPIAGEESVVVKLYLSLGAGLGILSKQHKAMGQLHTHVDGRRANGWLLHAPRPLLLSAEPAALVTTWVPGRPLGLMIRRGEMGDAAELRSAAGAILAGLGLFWSRCGRLYGDLNMENVLCDPHRRTLAFIDPGDEDPEAWFENVPRAWYPASHDLSYHLFNGAASVRAHLRCLGAWRRRLGLSEEMLRLFCADVPDASQRRQLLEEVRLCCGVHLRQIPVSPSPQGLWRWLVRRIASAQIDRVLARLGASRREVWA